MTGFLPVFGTIPVTRNNEIFYVQNNAQNNTQNNTQNIAKIQNLGDYNLKITESNDLFQKDDIITNAPKYGIYFEFERENVWMAFSIRSTLGKRANVSALHQDTHQTIISINFRLDNATELVFNMKDEQGRTFAGTIHEEIIKSIQYLFKNHENG